jgi:alkylation response protein AidB-like acyl-CoA dehydrogenase
MSRAAGARWPGRPTHGGQGLPLSPATGVMEDLGSANMGFSLVPDAEMGAVEALRRTARGIEAGLAAEARLRRMDRDDEPHRAAGGLDVGALKTRAEPAATAATGSPAQKIFITFGEHDLTDNIVHLVLARTARRAEGTRGISLFLVPKFPARRLARRNDLRCVSIEHKLGIHASPTCVMAFGDDGGATGWLIGEENGGHAAMFTMMNNARLNVGLQGVVDRRAATQRRSPMRASASRGSREGRPAAIIEHPDVRRMLLRMKALTQAARALAIMPFGQIDRGTPARATRRAARADLLTPLVKAWAPTSAARSPASASRSMAAWAISRRPAPRSIARRPHRADLRRHQRHPGGRPGRAQARARRRTSFVASGSFEIRGQRYAADGTPIDADFAISPSGGNHGEPRIAALPTGGFIVTWTYDAHDGTGVSAAAGTALRIRGQIFDSSAAKVGGVLALTSGNGSEQGDSQVITFADGSFALAWQNFLPAGERDALVQKFNSAGTATSGVVTISASTTGSQTQPALTALAGGGFVATWADTNSAAAGDSSSQGVKAQLFDSAGAKVGSEFLVNTIIPGQQYSPSVAALASGGFVVAWMSLSSTPFDPAFNDVKAQIFDAAGARVGGEFKVHEASEGEQVQPSVTALPGGGFVVAWRDGTLTDADVKAQAFDADGARSGTEFTLGTETDGLQSAPVVIGLANGGLAAAWVGTDDSGTGVKAQLFGTTDTAPSDIGFSSGSVSENLFENTSAGTLLAIGAANSGFTFEIVSDSTGGAFAVDGDQLIVVDNAKLDFETNPHATVTVRVTDDNGQTYEETLELDVADVLLEKRYSAGDEFIVNQSEAGPEYRPTLVPLASGGFAILWTQYTALPGEPTIYRTVLRVFDSAGAPVSGEIQLINPALADFTAAPLANGGFIVASNVANQPPGSRSVMAQAYDSAGNAVGPEMLAGSTTTGFPYGASVVQIGSGGFVLGWADQGEVSAQRFDAAGAKVGGEIPIATNFGADHFVLLATPNGGFVAAWEEGGPTGDGPYEAKATI